MKPVAFDYHAPASLEEALTLLAEHGDAAKALAGGQSLVPMLNLRLVRPRVLVSLRRLSALDYMRRDNGAIVVGSMTRQRRLEISREVWEACPLLTEAIHFVGHPTIRNQGTVGGSIAHADPAGELPAVLVALDGRVTLASTGGSRTVPAADFFRGLMTTDAQSHELITEIQFQQIGQPGHRRGHGFEEVSRRHGDFALAGVAVALSVDADGRVSEARIALLGVEARPRRCVQAETALKGQRWAADRLADVAALAACDLDPLADIHASAEFRVHLTRVLTRRALERAYRRAANPGEK